MRMNTDDTQKICGEKYAETDEQTAEGEAFFDNVADAQEAAEAIAAEEWERQASSPNNLVTGQYVDVPEPPSLLQRLANRIIRPRHRARGLHNQGHHGARFGVGDLVVLEMNVNRFLGIVTLSLYYDLHAGDGDNGISYCVLIAQSETCYGEPRVRGALVRAVREEEIAAAQVLQGAVRRRLTAAMHSSKIKLEQ